MALAPRPFCFHLFPARHFSNRLNTVSSPANCDLRVCKLRLFVMVLDQQIIEHDEEVSRIFFSIRAICHSKFILTQDHSAQNFSFNRYYLLLEIYFNRGSLIVPRIFLSIGTICRLKFILTEDLTVLWIFLSISIICRLKFILTEDPSQYFRFFLRSVLFFTRNLF